MFSFFFQSIQKEVDFDIWVEPGFEAQQLQGFVLRLDGLHPWIQGNKWFKLKPFEGQCASQGLAGFVSMGGAFSNHLIALACRASELGKACTLGIRGQKEEWRGNAAVAQLEKWGAQLISLSREEFRESQLSQKPPEGLKPWLEDRVWVPMGGTDSKPNPHLGAFFSELFEHFSFDYVVLPVATGGTFAGLLTALPAQVQALGIEVLKSKGFLLRDIQRMLGNHGQAIAGSWELSEAYHSGGYGKKNEALQLFCQRINREHRFKIEPIYSGKAFRAVSDLASKAYFKEKSKILMVHTGGVFPWNLRLSDPKA